MQSWDLTCRLLLFKLARFPRDKRVLLTRLESAITMLGLSVVLSVAFAAQAAFASPLHSRTPYAVKESHPVPRKWTPVSRAPGDHMLHMQIGLKQERFDELERHLYEGIS